MSDRHRVPENPLEAEPPSTTGPTRVYENDEIRVLWDATRCIHIGRCLRALPQVFDTRRRPWVDVNAAPPEAVADAVLTCPTGALRYESKGRVPPETPPADTEIQVRPNGPLFLRGPLRVTRPDGEVLVQEYRLALCRCGASQNKPFCDNSHRRIGFRG